MDHGRGEPLRGGHPPQPATAQLGRGLHLDVDAASNREPCLCQIPDYETDKEAESIDEEVYEAIFAAELDFWHRDSGTWPAERTYPLFSSLRTALQGLERR